MVDHALVTEQPLIPRRNQTITLLASLIAPQRAKHVHLGRYSPRRLVLILIAPWYDAWFIPLLWVNNTEESLTEY